jgi:hypothetical protein
MAATAEAMKIEIRAMRRERAPGDIIVCRRRDVTLGGAPIASHTRRQAKYSYTVTDPEHDERLPVTGVTDVSDPSVGDVS